MRSQYRSGSDTWMAVLLTTMFIGTSVMAYFYHVHPHENETVVSKTEKQSSRVEHGLTAR